MEALSVTEPLDETLVVPLKLLEDFDESTAGLDSQEKLFPLLQRSNQANNFSSALLILFPCLLSLSGQSSEPIVVSLSFCKLISCLVLLAQEFFLSKGHYGYGRPYVGLRPMLSIPERA